MFVAVTDPRRMASPNQATSHREIAELRRAKSSDDSLEGVQGRDLLAWIHIV
jgi:hypothetical protein